MPQGSKRASITPALLHHAAAIVSNNAAMALETEGKRLDEERLTRGVRLLLEDRAKGFYLVAETDGAEVIGQLMVTFEWSDWRAGTFWWVQSVYVVPTHRRQGIYRALYERVLEMAREDGGVCGVRLYVERENVRAMETYRALGMARAHYEMFEVDFVLT